MKKKSALLAVLVVGLAVLGAATPDHASDRWHGGVFIGVGPWWGLPYWGPYAYWYPPPYSYPPAVIIEEPPVYIEQPPPAPPPPAPPAYWYYCVSATAYYPNVQSCPEEWVKVPARP